MSKIPSHRAVTPAPVKGGYKPEEAKAAEKDPGERRSPKADKTPAKKAEK